MKNKEKKICFVSSNPNIDGGMTNYLKNLIKYLQLKEEKLNITWVYKSNKNEAYTKDRINYVGLKVKKIIFIDDFTFNEKLKKYFKKNYFDIINSHAIWGYWMKNYKRKENQILINTYHGATYPYYKIHLKRFGLIKKILLSPLLLYSYIIEKPPIKNANKVICVSEKVKNQIENVYGKRKEIHYIRTGVDLSKFKQRDKTLIRKEIGLEKDKIYGLHVAKGGYWIKGLDRAVKLSEEIYKKNKDYRLIAIGPNFEKNKHFLNKKFIISLEKVQRDKIPLYYSSSDIFLCLSRYEGGAPTLVTSEAMSSGCLLVCSKDSEQEIIEDNKNGLILNKFDKEESERILKLLNNKRLKEKIIKNAISTIKTLSLEKWGEKYWNVLSN
jgi:glycosyltransferase involved in cell wall biosynthesis